ncbi:MAG: caspase family protein, partial [Pseudomonadota bacterium]
MARHIECRAIWALTATPRILIAAIFVLIAFSWGAHDAMASKRVALVIGNSAYENASALANPSNDASDMGTALNDLGFEVVIGTDLDNRAMRAKVREFGRLLRGADVAMLFYAGHAMQVGGKNFLAPIDAKLEFESDLDFETIPLSFIQQQMEREAKTILLFLDACRDNPLTRSFKASSRSGGAGRGLAEEKLSSSGILIAFATNPGNIALDGNDRNSPF